MSGATSLEVAEEGQGSLTRWQRIAPHLIILIILIITTIPYLIGYLNSDGRRYLWLGYNFDDASVYLTWIRQTSTPSLKVFNHFTNDAQSGLFANPLFLLLGLVQWLTKIPLLGVFHLARLLFGYTLLLSVWNLLKSVLKANSPRLFALLFVALSAGLGWLPFWNDAGFESPIDRWQPEGFTFHSLYLNPLFTASMTLQVLALGNLYRADQTGENRFVIKAGLASLLLALVHGYDVITLAVIWTLYLFYRSKQGENVARVWKQALMVAGMALPGVLFMLSQIKSETVFRERIAVATLSASPHWIALGYGLPLLLAIAAILRQRNIDSTKAIPFLTLWMLGNLLASYLPFSFQRKLLQGTHIPIAILAVIALDQILSTKPRGVLITAKVGVLLLSSLSLWGFLVRDIQNTQANATQTQLQRPYLRKGEEEAFDWIIKNTAPQATIQPLPHLKLITDQASGNNQTAVSDTTLATITPWYCNRAVYCGHFGETPRYQDRLNALNRFLIPFTPVAEKERILREMHVQYLVYSQKESEADALAPVFRHRLPLPKYLKQVYTSETVDIYEVQLVGAIRE